MNIVLFFCEQATTGSDSKLNVKGIYNELYATDFPAKQDRIVLAGIVEWDRDVEGTQPFKIDLLDTDNISIFTIEGHSEIDARPDDRVPAKTHLIFPLENLVFPGPGQYQIRLDILSQQIAGPSLYLMHTPQNDKKENL